MPVVLVHQGPTLTQDKYDEIARRFSEGRGRLESPSDWPVAGLLSHAAGDAPSGFRVVDVWESEEACKAVRRCSHAAVEGDRGYRAAGDLSGACLCPRLTPSAARLALAARPLPVASHRLRLRTNLQQPARRRRRIERLLSTLLRDAKAAPRRRAARYPSQIQRLPA
jgi:hypothetical protein